jgi:DNA polymerase-3 subunit epsilon
MMREVVLDTETTGTDARNGDRVIEIGCVELVNHCPTGRTFHTYLNPQAKVSDGAFGVHGLSDAFLADKPLFASVADAFAEFIKDARLIIHNAAFDVGFLDMEFARLGRKDMIDPKLVVDTLTLARRKHPGASNSLDALCARYGIDSSRRVKHGALLDAEILSEVYIELIGGKQADFGLSAAGSTQKPGLVGAGVALTEVPQRAAPLPPRLDDAARAAHDAFVGTLGASPLWRAGQTPGRSA